MTKLQELIEQLCPNGVEYRALENILKIKNGTDYKGHGKGDIPVYGSGGIITYIDSSSYDKPSVLIPRKGSVDKLYYVEQPFWNVDTIFYTEINTNLAVPKFVYYCLQKEHLEKYNTAGGVPSLTQKVLNKVTIPMPPLEIQHEIVRILDSFTEHIADLTRELSSERISRKMQYDYYRTMLFTFESTTNFVELGEIASVTKLAGFEFTNYVIYSDNGAIIALRGLNIKEGHLVLEDVKYIDGSDFSKLERSKLQIGDMLFTYVGTVGQVALIDENDKYYLAPNVAMIRITNDNILPRYLLHYFQSSSFKKEQIDRLLQSSSMKNIPMEKIRKFKIPVVPIEVQKQIVNALDNYDAVCSDLGINLPLEIDAREKQYEYYRDLLLTFATGSQSVNVERERESRCAARG